jgi:hypothetical protein
MAVLAAIAPLGLAFENNSYWHEATAADKIARPYLRLDLARPTFDYPGEFLLAVNLTPGADYFTFAIKQVGQYVVKAGGFKKTRTGIRLYLVSLVILLFYIFYLNSRTTSEADPDPSGWGKIFAKYGWRRADCATDAVKIRRN